MCTVCREHFRAFRSILKHVAMVHVAAGCFGLLRFERTVEDPDTVRAAGFFGGSTGGRHFSACGVIPQAYGKLLANLLATTGTLRVLVARRARSLPQLRRRYSGWMAAPSDPVSA